MTIKLLKDHQHGAHPKWKKGEVIDRVHPKLAAELIKNGIAEKAEGKYDQKSTYTSKDNPDAGK